MLHVGFFLHILIASFGTVKKEFDSIVLYGSWNWEINIYGFLILITINKTLLNKFDYHSCFWLPFQWSCTFIFLYYPFGNFHFLIIISQFRNFQNYMFHIIY